MRIISGVAGGRRIRAPDTTDTRPATDRVREAVFSAIAGLVVEADVVDLYAGSGSFGLEALSRGARSALFVEKAPKALRALRTNVETLGLGGEISARTVRGFLSGNDRRFHLAFVDPPWSQETGDMEADLEALDPFLHPGAEVVVSRRCTDPEPRIPKTWRVAANKCYGDTRILRYRKAESEE